MYSGINNGYAGDLTPPPDKMVAIPQTIYSDIFSWMKSLIFLFNFH